MRLHQLTALLFALAMLGVSGCQKLSGPLYDKTVEVETAEFNEVGISAPKKDQKVSVTASSASGSVSVYVVLDKDLAAAKDRLEKQQSLTSNVLGKKEKTKDAALEVMIPGGQAFTVLVANESGKKVSVALKIANLP